MENHILNNIYIINSGYKIRSDRKRLVLTNNDSSVIDIFDIGYQDSIETSFCWLMHPYVGYLFSFFDGVSTLKDVLSRMKKETDIQEDFLLLSIKPFINNEKTQYFKINDKFPLTALPKNFLIKTEKKEKANNFPTLEEISVVHSDLDLNTVRHFVPNDFTLMITTACLTKCVYCYADVRKNYDPISFDRICSIIDEGRSLNVRDITINGGDIFMYKNWQNLFKKLLSNNYNPVCSTKVPIKRDIIENLAKIGIKNIQFSLDSTDPKTLSNILGVDLNYFNSVKETFTLLEDYSIDLRVKAVITNQNDSIEGVRNLIDFLSKFNNFKHLSIAAGEYSHYQNKNTFFSTKEKISAITEFINKINNNYSFHIQNQGYAEDISNVDFKEKMQAFKNRNMCTGNVSSFYVLPDGKVTLCEQMYWHPFFIIGDLKHQSIMEMWNSKKALSLWNFSKNDIKKESPCFLCPVLEQCRRGRGNCWRNAFFAYGDQNYDYPAPNCPFAPEVKNDIFVK